MGQANFDRHLKPGDAKAALERIAASKAYKESRFSQPSYQGEPILRTGGELKGSGAIKTTAGQRREREGWSGGFAPAGKATGTVASCVDDGKSGGCPSDIGVGTQPAVKSPIQTTASQRRERERWSGGFESFAKVYGDEAIPKRPVAAEAGKSVSAKAQTSRPYRMIHDLAQREDLRYAPASKVFYEQARLLADVESQADPHVPFQSYFPTYQVMNDKQLNAYLSWRTSARKGVIAAPTPSFAFVYVYELLMGVGAQHGAPAFNALHDFWQLWRGEAQAQKNILDFYLRTWLRDYVVCQGLDVALYNQLQSEDATKSDADDVYAAVPKLREAENVVLGGGKLEGELARQTFDALCQASSFRLSGSKFYKDYPEQTVEVTCRVFARMAVHCSKRRKVGFIDGLFGAAWRKPHPMFYGAVHYEPEPHRDATYRVSESESFVCRDNSWRHKLPCVEEMRSRDLGLILHAVDHEMRLVWGYPKQVQAYGGAQFMKNFVAKEAAAVHEQWQAAQVPEIKIDRSLLRGIRKAAVKTRESLLVDEERGEEATWVPGGAGAGVAGAACDGATASHGVGGAVESHGVRTSLGCSGANDTVEVGATSLREAAFVIDSTVNPLTPADNPCGLSAAELAFLRAVLSGDAAAQKAAVGAGMLSLMVDSVNEKLFDQIGDAVVECDGASATLVEDYRPDVEALL